MNSAANDGSAEKNGYVDLQVNGYVGIDFNRDGVTLEEFRTVCESLRDDGVATILATIITDAPERMAHRLSQITDACERDPFVNEVIAGIHIEGPFLNPGEGTVGAHPRRYVLPGDVDVMKILLDAAAGRTKLVTLAPESDPGLKTTQMLSDLGILVSAGHCDPSREQLLEAVDAGLSLFTHLGNGCSLNVDRHDNVIQRVLSLSDRVRCCFIADGIHIPPFALANYLKIAGIERSIVVTDAMSAAGLGAGRYRIGLADVDVDENLRAELVGGDGRLAGSAATMPRMRNILTEQVGLSEQETEKLLIHNPRQLLQSMSPQDSKRG